MERAPDRRSRIADRMVVAGAHECDHVDVTMHATDDATPKGPRHEHIVLRRPSQVEHPEAIDLAVAIEILNSSELGDEIWAANNYDPDLEA